MKKLIFTAFLVFWCATTFAHMHGGTMGGGMAMGMMGEHMDEMIGACLSNAAQLRLSDEQIAKLQPIHREMQKKQAKFMAEIKVTELELAEVMDVKDFDLQKAEEITKKISDLRFEHHKELLKLMKEVRTILTVEQYQKMKKMKMMGMTTMQKNKMTPKKPMMNKR